jgi:PHP family Zn ribbon phosphoesterase
MKAFKADLHIHTVLSPCGDLEMSPVNIIREARNKGIDIIGITDHNSTMQAELVHKIGADNGIIVLTGVEITTKEEVHCLAFFKNTDFLVQFQQYLDMHLPHIVNSPDKFGYQVVVDESENIIYEAPFLLLNGLNQSITQIEKKVHELNGLFIPAHVNRSSFSLTSQLGFVPPDIQADALEISRHISREQFHVKNKGLKHFNIIQSSDAHFIQDIGMVNTEFLLEVPCFEEIQLALQNKLGRSVLNQ